MKNIIFIVIIFFVVIGCMGCQSQERYELNSVEKGDGYQLFKIDKFTGEVWALSGQSWAEVESAK